MALGKIVKTNGKFEFIELTDDEQYAAISEAISKNICLFNKCRVDVGSYLMKHKLEDCYRDQVQIALAVFNAVAMKGFTVLDTALSRKISDLKDNGSK